ncbi:MAG: flagellar M-ring protein FliF [Bacteroidetes bacterium]|nr:MAG: flagellar M-ring protein FliF [Bacteroidota bacterium]
MAKLDVGTQIRNFFNRLTIMQRIMIGIVFIAVISGMYLIVSSVTAKEKSVLFTGLDEKEASKIVQKLKDDKIEYDLQENGSTILIEKDKVYDTRLSLASEGLPESGMIGYELFDKTNLGMSEFVQKLNYRRALEGELAKTISSIEDVNKARVHIVIPEKALFDKDQKPPTASVSLHLKGNRGLAKTSIEGIQNLVSGSIEGMKPEDVIVVDQRGKILSESPQESASIAGMTATQYQQQMKVEHYLADKVQSMLDGVLGEGNSEVRVNAELNFDQIDSTVKTYDPEKQVVRSEQSVSESSSSADSSTRSDSLISYVSPSSSNTRSKSNTISNYEIPETIARIIKEVGNIKRLSVAALINGTYDKKNISGRDTTIYNPRSDSVMLNLDNIVKKAVGYDPMRNDQVSVLNVRFDTTPIEETGTAEDVKWYNNPDYKIIFLLAAIVITMFLMYRLLQSKQIKERLRIAFSLPEKISVEEEEEEVQEQAERLEEIAMGEEQLLLTPGELPEQLLLEGERGAELDAYDDEEFGKPLDKEALASMARARLEKDELSGFTEDVMLKMELKNKVQEYIEGQTQDAVRMIRMMLVQEPEEIKTNK